MQKNLLKVLRYKPISSNLSISRLFHYKTMSTIRESQLVFNLSAEEITKETDRLIQSSRKVLDQVATLPEEKRDFDSVVYPLSVDEAYSSVIGNNVTFPAYVSPTKEIRDAGNEAQKQLEEFEIESSLRVDVYQSLLSVKNKQWDQLDEDQQRLLSRMLREFERNGLNLDEEKRNQIKELKGKLSKLQIEFQKNLAEDKTTLLFDKAELEGLPEEFIESLPKKDDKYELSLKYPELVPTMQYCKVESTRQKMEFASSTKCMEQNAKLLEDAIQVRRELAKLLGYASHPNFVLDIRMAKTPENVHKFLYELKDKLYPGGQKELERLVKLKESFKKERNEEAEPKINAWDFNFYMTLLKDREYQVNQNLIKDYFPFEKVLNGVLEFFQQVLGLTFEEATPKTTWFSEVRLFKVYDAETKDFVGEFYLDLFPREGKYTHFAAFPLQPSMYYKDGTRQYPVSAMVCNFTKPTKDRPSLLKHDEVVTFLHEFGHLLHGFCSKAKYSRFSGTSVERDFVECPSQLMENWCWEKDFLKRISSHYQTGEPLPDDVIDKMVAAKNVNSGLTNLRQLFFGIFDMTIHNSEGSVNSAELYSKLRKEVSLIENTPNTNGAASFGHLMGGYDVGYYGYLWSQVYSADMFAAFKEKGLFSKEVGKRYRKHVLETGGMKDGDVIVRNFLGREPSQDAFLKSIGL